MTKTAKTKSGSAKKAPGKMPLGAAKVVAAPRGIKRMTDERAGAIGGEVKKLAVRKDGVTMKEIEEKVGRKYGLSDDQRRKIVRDMVDEGALKMVGARARTVYRAG